MEEVKEKNDTIKPDELDAEITREYMGQGQLIAQKTILLPHQISILFISERKQFLHGPNLP